MARQCDVAFSRVQLLLVLSAGAMSHPVFGSVMEGAPDRADVDPQRLSDR